MEKITKFCLNLRKLYISIQSDELETLKMILNNCQYLESIEIWGRYSDLKELFEIFTKYSPKNFHELTLNSLNMPSKKDLEEFFINWNNRRSLSFIVFMDYSLRDNNNYEIMKVIEVIEKYKKLGIIKKFETSKHWY